MSIEIREAGLADLEAIRVIRNQCRHLMTGTSAEILAKQQALWWANMPAYWTLYVLKATMYGVVGYGLVRPNAIPVGSVLTGAIIEQHRGKGYGRHLFKFMIDNSPRPHILEVMKTNGNAIRLYRSLGFEDLGSKTTSMLMERR